MFSQLTTIEDVQKAYDELCLQETQLESDIKGLLDNEKQFEAKIKTLRKQMPNTNLLQADATELLNTVGFTATLAQNVSFKVRKLDLAKERVAQCLQRVGDIADLKTCTEGIQVALDNEEYENAAQLVQRFLEFDKTDMKRAVADEGEADSKIAGDLTESSLDEAFAKLHEAKKKLQEIVLKKFDEAVREDDIASVERYFKMFPLLNQKQEGLRKFSNYLCTKIGNQAIPSDAGVSESHPEKLGQLYQTIAKVIDIHQPMVETFYKPGNMLSVIETLQKECDVRAKRIFEDFRVKKNFSQTVATIRKSLKNSSSAWSSASTIKIDPRDTDLLLTEITLVNSRSETYLKFIRKRVIDDIEVAYPESSSEQTIRKEKLLQTEKLLRDCDLSRAVQDLNGNYVLLEEYFLHESAQKAIDMDEANDENSLTSNMLDDVFFILKKCIRRATSSGSVDVLCAVINHSVSVLDAAYYDALDERVRYGYPGTISSAAAALDLSQAYSAISAGRYLQSSSEIEKAKRLYLTAVNNLDLSCDYVKTLKSSIKEEVKRTLNSLSVNQNEMLESCLADMTALTGKFQALVAHSLTQMNLSVLKPRIKMWVEAFTSCEHNLSEEDLMSSEASEGLRPFTQSFLVGIDEILKGLKPKLTESNYDTLISIFSTELTNRFENAVLKCSFNKLGGFQFDRELRATISYLTSATSWSIRDKFSRLKQIAMLLNMDSVAEVCDYFSSHQITEANTLAALKLTPNEVRKFMKCRCDFSASDVRKAKL